jgi:hypothetical protein
MNKPEENGPLLTPSSSSDEDLWPDEWDSEVMVM